MGHLVVAWYGWLSQLAQGPILAIESWNDALDVPTLSALLFGLIGATSPCQLTTNLGALAFSASRPGRLGPVWASLSYAFGKVAVYFMVGAAVIFLGFGLQAASIPVVVVARKLLGPLMLVIGLGLIGWIRLPRAGGGVGEALWQPDRHRVWRVRGARAVLHRPRRPNHLQAHRRDRPGTAGREDRRGPPGCRGA